MGASTQKETFRR